MSKIKSFFSKILSKVSGFFRMIFGFIGNLLNKLMNTKVMKKVSYYVGWLPNQISKRLTHQQSKAIWGFIFIIPLMIGLVYYFVLPFISTIVYSFSNVVRITDKTVTGEVVGVVTEWTGMDNYKYVWNVHSTFKDTLFGAFTDTLLDVLIILIFSLIIAVVLNSKFRGRAFVRAVFFMPVIFNSQAIDMAMQTGSVITESMEEAGGNVFTNLFNFADFLTNANLPPTAVTFLSTASASIFDVITYSGVQILIFLSAIQAVPKHLYEAAKVEGATQYEIFWKITFPMVTPMMLTAGVYTVVDSFLRSDLLSLMASYQNAGYRNYSGGLGILTNDGIYAAMSVLFILLSAFSLVVVFVVLSKAVFYYDE